MDAAAELLAAGAGEHDEGADPTEMLAAALAKLAGHGELRTRSLLTSHSGQTTLSFVAGGTTEIRTPTYVWNFLRQRLEENDLQIRRPTLCTDHKGAVFDVPSELAEKFVALSEDQGSGPTPITISVCEELPELVAKPQSANGFGGGGRGGGYGGGRGAAGRLLRRTRTRRVQPRGTRARRSRRRPGVRRARPRVRTKRESARRYSILFGSRRAVWKPRDATRVECVVKHALILYDSKNTASLLLLVVPVEVVQAGVVRLHDELRAHLPGGVRGDAHQDEQRRAREAEGGEPGQALHRGGRQRQQP